MSVGNHAHHRLVSQYREMRVIRWRVKDGCRRLFPWCIFADTKKFTRRGRESFLSIGVDFLHKTQWHWSLFRCQCRNRNQKGKNTQLRCVFLPFCLVRYFFPRCRGPPPASEIWFPIFQKWSKSFSTLGNWIMNIPMMYFCDFCVGCKVADRELLSQKHEITSQRVK